MIVKRAIQNENIWDSMFTQKPVTDCALIKILILYGNSLISILRYVWHSYYFIQFIP
jgi:hypothetical protein